MKRTFHWLAAATLMLAAGSAATRRDAPASPGPGPSASIRGLDLSIRLEKRKFASNEPVVLQAIIGNQSNSRVDLGESVSDLGSFDFSVEYVAGGLFQHTRMPLTHYGAALLRTYLASKNIPIRLAPGAEAVYRFPLSRMVDLTLAGTYAVRVDRFVPGAGRHDWDGSLLPAARSRTPELVSNQVFLEVSEAERPERIRSMRPHPENAR